MSAHCDDLVIKKYCNGTFAWMGFIQCGKIYAGRITEYGYYIYPHLKLALRGGNLKFLSGMTSVSNYDRMVAKCIKWNYLEGIKMLDSVCHIDYKFPTDGMSKEMYQLCLWLRPMGTHVNCHH